MTKEITKAFSKVVKAYKITKAKDWHKKAATMSKHIQGADKDVNQAIKSKEE